MCLGFSLEVDGRTVITGVELVELVDLLALEFSELEVVVETPSPVDLEHVSME